MQTFTKQHLNFFKSEQNIILFILCLAFMTSCNPFKGFSEIVIDPIILKNQKTNMDMNSGGTTAVVTHAPPGFPRHVIEMSVGNTYQQNSYLTSQGHVMEINISGVNQ